jgi:hypothetical protein
MTEAFPAGIPQAVVVVVVVIMIIIISSSNRSIYLIATILTSQ